jgi:alpha-tubulin suppressor-like RCC1 family protein
MATRVATGTSHSCARLGDGRVLCWGRNDHGQLGSPSADICAVEDLLHGGPAVPVPCRDGAAPVDELAGASDIALGGSTSCARLDGGSVRCWGDNSLGLVGDGTTTDRARPTAVVGLARVAEIAISDTHACARLATGTLACWGQNFFGQLGTPPVPPPEGEVSRSGHNAVKVLAPVAVPGVDEAVEVAVGSNITCVRKKGGAVLCFGQVAPGTRASSTAAEIAELRGADDLVLGNGTHCALFERSMRCWGSRSSGPMLGSSRATLPPVAASATNDVSHLALIGHRACAVNSGGDVVCWGDNGKSATTPPERVGLAMKARAVSLGANHACALGVDGSVWCWGDSFFGEAGSRPKASAPTSAFWTPPRQLLP